MYVSSIAVVDVETLFVCLHRLRLASAGTFDPRSAQVELFSEPLCSILQVLGSFALLQTHINTYIYIFYLLRITPPDHEKKGLEHLEMTNRCMSACGLSILGCRYAMLM